MGDRIAYYGWLKLGDYMTAVEIPKLEGESVTIEDVIDANYRAMVTRGASSSYGVQIAFRMQYGQVSGETQREYRKRRFNFVKQFATVKRMGSAPVAIIEDSESDVSTVQSTAAPANPATITVDAIPTGLAVGDYVLIASETDNAAECVAVTAIDTTALEIQANTTITVRSGDPLALVEWYLPRVAHNGELPISGQGDGGGFVVTEDVTVDLMGVDDPVFRP